MCKTYKAIDCGGSHCVHEMDGQLEDEDYNE
jgi:hypothetical protein